MFERVKHLHSKKAGGETLKGKELFEIESWEKMREYPDLKEADLTDESDLMLLAWVIETFMAFVCRRKTGAEGKRESSRTRTLEFYNKLFEHVTLDDLVFMFVQVQNNINKWRLVWHAFEEKLVPAWEHHKDPEDCECNKKSLAGKDNEAANLELVNLINDRGYEFPKGAGVAGTDGRRRYNHLTEYFFDHYFNTRDNPNAVEANRRALIKAIIAFAETKGDVPATEEDIVDAGYGNGKKDKNGGREQEHDNTKMVSIMDSQWDGFEGFEITAV